MQGGCAGLLKAINGFASEVGDSLSAYAARRRSRFRFSLALAADADVGRLKRTWTGVAICALACAELAVRSPGSPATWLTQANQ